MSSLSRKIPADLPEEIAGEIKRLAVEAFHAIGAAGVSRVDFLMDAETRQVWINEINTIPGSLAFYLWEASGMPFTKLVDNLISLALKRRRRMDKLSFTFDSNILSGMNRGNKLKI